MQSTTLPPSWIQHQAADHLKPKSLMNPESMNVFLSRPIAIYIYDIQEAKGTNILHLTAGFTFFNITVYVWRL